MFKHHLLISLRNIQRFKASFLINLVGLSTGLLCAFLIFLWVNDERRFDTFHANDKRLFQVMQISKENDELVVHDGTQGLLASSMAKDLPEVQHAVAVMSLHNEGMSLNLKTPDKTLKATGIYTGEEFFSMFSFNIINGNTTEVLKKKDAIVLTEKFAKAFFGSAQAAMGKPLEYELFGKKMNLVVTGVCADLPASNSMKFDFALNYETLLAELWPNGLRWGNTGPETYLLLKENTNVAAFNAKIKSYLRKYDDNTIFTMFVRPYSSAYLHGNYVNGIQSGGRIEYVNLFSIIGIAILLIACINFMNLSTARASRRLKEVGIKKAVGSTRSALVMQFLSEAIFIAFLSLLVACFAVVLIMPAFNQLTGKEIVLQPDVTLLAMLIGVTLVTGLVAGSYPAFYLSGFNPVSVLKGRPKNSVGELLARKGLVVFQFTVSLVLIICVMVVYRQMQFVQTTPLGYDKENIIRFDKTGTIDGNPAAFLNELKKIPGVRNASALEQRMAQKGNGASTYGITWPGKKENQLIDFALRAVDYNLIETLNINVIAGRSFAENFGSDSTGLIFNEAAIKIMGLRDPVGTPVKLWGQDMTIIGVVKNFHISSLHEPIVPMAFRYAPERTGFIVARIAPAQQKQTLARIAELHKTFNPGNPFEYTFFDEEYQAQYVAEQRVSVLAGYFAGLAVLITCLGLFGLATFNAEVRNKEIGIRKVLGASVASVMILLSKDFFKLVLIAVLIAFPLAWWAASEWLKGFAYKTTIGADIFLVSLAAIILITIATISMQSLKAAFSNPTRSLRSVE
ncbi:MAG: ABC transporter permease [Chitinophagaceae bacterium]|nr:MAG: ABC transporter permease [Chitinophagaceae bacterium]